MFYYIMNCKDMTSEGLGEMFEGDSSDMCAGKFPLVSMRVSCAQTRERGPPSVPAEFKNLIQKIYGRCVCVQFISMGMENLSSTTRV